MKRFEDHFSRRAKEYARHRPRYPEELFSWLASIAPARRLAWDCGTGNGQAAVGLVRHFERVVATDASADQLGHAFPHERIEYRVEAAEEVRLEPGSVDLVTVATAVHWFDHDRFYPLVRRVAADGGILAVWAYHLPAIAPAIDPILVRYYTEIVGGFWPERFRYVAERYRTLPFPFEELAPPEFGMQASWTMEDLVGHLESWSATQRYQQERHVDPVTLIRPELAKAWGGPRRRRTIRWPLNLRVGRVK